MEEYKDLINVLHCLKMGVGLEVCEDCNLYPCDHSAVESLFRVAIKAVKKQIPKKPSGDLNSVPHYRCPSCHNAIVVYEYGYRYPNCKWCGQAIDWSKNERED